MYGTQGASSFTVVGAHASPVEDQRVCGIARSVLDMVLAVSLAGWSVCAVRVYIHDVYMRCTRQVLVFHVISVFVEGLWVCAEW